MRFTAFVFALLGTASAAGAQGTQVIEAPRDIGAPLVFEIMVRQYGADNQTAGSAGTSGTSTSGKFESYVWTSTGLCGLSASSNEPSSVPGVGWHFTGTVLGSSPGMMSVRVDWQRVWDKGAKLQAGPAGSQTISLREGERLELDRVLPVGQSTCATANARLEAAVITRPAYLVGVANDRLAAARGAAMAGGRGGGGGGGRGGGGRGGVATVTSGGGASTGAVTGTAGRGVSTGTVSGTGAAAGATTGVAGGRGGGGGGGRGGGRGAGTTTSTQTGAVAAGTNTTVTTTGAGGATNVVAAGRGGAGRGSSAGGRGDAGTLVQDARGSYSLTWSQTGVAAVGSFDAELWLVHRKPDGTETVQQQTLRFGGPVGQYAFPPIQVSTSRGVITLDVTGKLMAFTGDPPDPNALDGRLLLYRKILTKPGADAQPAPRILLSISRRARASGTPLLDITGGSSMVMDVPSPTDVLSFEFPALQKAAEDLLKGHQFSLRVRVTPVAR